MSGRNENATYANVNPKAKNGTAGTTGATGLVVAGGSAISFPNQNRPSPDPSYFAKANAERAADSRYTTVVR